jgi:hypothetical protein
LTGTSALHAAAENIGMLELQNNILEMVAKGEALKPTADRYDRLHLFLLR